MALNARTRDSLQVSKKKAEKSVWEFLLSY
jgi:hypothetical protein